MTKQSISSKIFKKNTGESCRNLRSSTRRRRKLMILSVNSIIWTKIFKDQRFPSMIQSSKCLITNLWTRSKWASWMKDHIKLKHQSHRETEIEMIAETLSKCSMIYPTMKEVLPGDVFQEWAKLMITLKTTSAKISKAIMQSNLRIFIRSFVMPSTTINREITDTSTKYACTMFLWTCILLDLIRKRILWDKQLKAARTQPYPLKMSEFKSRSSYCLFEMNLNILMSMRKRMCLRTFSRYCAA